MIEQQTFRFVELQQGAPDWLRWRTGGIGGSDAGAILAAYRGQPDLWPFGTAEELFAEKLGRGKREQTFAMRRGNRLEPKARELFTWRTGIPVKPVCVEHMEAPWLRASLDGWRHKGEVVLEIKAPCIEDHIWCLNGLVPPKYRPQLVHECLVTGAEEVYYFSYSEHSSVEPYQQTALVVYRPEADELGELLEAEEAFWKRVEYARQAA